MTNSKILYQKFRQRKIKSLSCFQKRKIRHFDGGCAATAKKCTKKRDTGAKLLRVPDERVIRNISSSDGIGFGSDIT